MEVMAMRGEKRGREFGSQPEVAESEGHERNVKQEVLVHEKLGAKDRQRQPLEGGQMRQGCPEDAAPTNVIVGVVAHDGRAGELDPGHESQDEEKSRRAFERGISAGAIGEARSRMRRDFGVA